MCGNLSPWRAPAHVKWRGWGAAQEAGARPAGPTAQLTWTGRACGLGLQRCGLPFWKAGVRSLGLFFGLHISEGTCGHSPRGVVRHCPSQCTHHRPPDPVRTGAAPGAGAAGTRRSLSPSHSQRPRGGGHEQGVPQGCAYPTPVPTPSPALVPTPGGHPVTCCLGLLAGPPKGDITPASARSPPCLGPLLQEVPTLRVLKSGDVPRVGPRAWPTGGARQPNSSGNG